MLGLVLLSGGLDSTTTLAIAKSESFEPCAITFRYGQRHQHEIACAHNIAASMGLSRHVIIDIDLRVFGGSALTSDIAVPKDRPIEAMAGEIPVTYDQLASDVN